MDCIWLSADFSVEIMYFKSELQNIFKVYEGKTLLTKNTLPARLSFRFNREIKSFSDKPKLRIQHHQARFTKMLKELSRWETQEKGIKEEGRNKAYKANPKQLTKWQ